MSLQFDPIRHQFVADCARLWSTWLQGGSSPMERQARREQALTQAIGRTTQFMVPPAVRFAATGGGWASFDWTTWRLTVNHNHTRRDDIRYRNFVELCATVYHETRHAEQFYRIAQGLAAGRLKFPDASAASDRQAMHLGPGGVAARIKAFDAVAQGQSPLGQKPAPPVSVIARRLSIPQHVVQHASTRATYFNNYLNASRPTWFKRPTVLDEINEWMRATGKKTYSEMDAWAQDDDSDRERVNRMYRDLPEENDAHGIEEKVAAEIVQRIGHATDRSRRRNDLLFGP
ncbi:MAG: hypothetical protein KC620_11885 [Myxococcales bacterium]|nr:hypothetical protein [Myxococcales bacterium]